ncbi:hypothetical protein ACTXI9_16015 [Brachybacterium alimentarium]|uniref:hypothetical protein n=1 Tax=Brachybacterium alimentarium TaxID=47845 RepID=UPI003FD104D8
MFDRVQIYCDELGVTHGTTHRRKQWIETFKWDGKAWESTPPPRSRLSGGDEAEVLHRTSEVAVTTEGEAFGYAYRVLRLKTRRFGQPPSRIFNGYEVLKVAINLRNGEELQAELGDDYRIDHRTYEMRCPCGKTLPVRRERLHRILDQVRTSGATDELSLSLLERAVQHHP